MGQPCPPGQSCLCRLGGGTGYHRSQWAISAIPEPGCNSTPEIIGVDELSRVWGWTGTDSTPAPNFYNAAFVAYEFGGPALISACLPRFRLLVADQRSKVILCTFRLPSAAISNQ